jgi:hypothetical protein
VRRGGNRRSRQSRGGRSEQCCFGETPRSKIWLADDEEDGLEHATEGDDRFFIPQLTEVALVCCAAPATSLAPLSSDAALPRSDAAPRAASRPADARPRPPPPRATARLGSSPAAPPGLAPPRLNCIGGEKRGRGRERKEEKKEAAGRGIKEGRGKKRKKKRKGKKKENKLFICRKYD